MKKTFYLTPTLLQHFYSFTLSCCILSVKLLSIIIMLKWLAWTPCYSCNSITLKLLVCLHREDDTILYHLLEGLALEDLIIQFKWVLCYNYWYPYAQRMTPSCSTFSKGWLLERLSPSTCSIHTRISSFLPASSSFWNITETNWIKRIWNLPPCDMQYVQV